MRFPDRRKSERLELDDRTTVLQGPYRLLNIGGGGFALESDVPFERADVRTFQFAVGEGAVVMLRARVVHSVYVVSETDRPRHVTGFALLADTDEADVVRLIGAIATGVTAMVAA